MAGAVTPSASSDVANISAASIEDTIEDSALATSAGCLSAHVDTGNTRATASGLTANFSAAWSALAYDIVFDVESDCSYDAGTAGTSDDAIVNVLHDVACASITTSVRTAGMLDLAEPPPSCTSTTLRAEINHRTARSMD